MKKIFIPILFVVLLPTTFSCGLLRNYTLNEADAAAAIKQLLEKGIREGSLNGAFSKDMIMSTVFPESVKKALNTLNQLGLTPEIDRFTSTMTLAAEKTAERSIPIFLNAVTTMSVTDAMNIVKGGGTAATDYLRARVGAQLRQSITPVMQTALDEYKLNDQWKKMTAPVQSMLGSRVNLDLANLMAGVVSESMFRKIAQKEQEVRNNASARTTTLLRKVFGRNWQ